MNIMHEKQQQKICNLSKSQIKDTTSEKNYPRIINTTDTRFTQEEIQLLSKGLKLTL
jgi:hypothetical protein